MDLKSAKPLTNERSEAYKVNDQQNIPNEQSDTAKKAARGNL